MKREIKFRYWNGGAMVYEDMPLPDPTWILHNKMYKPYGENVLMQFTGLKDKNGKEVYEGDIVMAVYVESEGGGWTSDHKVIGKVYFDTHWGVKFDCKDHTQRVSECWATIPHTDFKAVEIIGNIYENPGLIKQ
jgi:uncharacterized phage protein (TIGR01671 family)